MVDEGSTQVTITGSSFGTSPTLNLPPGVTSSNQQSSNTQIIVTLTASASATVGNGNISVNASGQTSNTKQIALDGPYDMVVLSDTNLPVCVGCTTRKRLVTYQVKNFSGSNAGETNICEIPTTPPANCSPKYPGGQWAACPSLKYTDSNGQFTDQWSLSDYDIYSPPTCGINVTPDQWYWGLHYASGQHMATLSGYIHVNAIQINGTTTPGGSGLPIGVAVTQ